MASPFCTICKNWEDSVAVYGCEEFPFGALEVCKEWGRNASSTKLTALR
jgi:hypothetical protein